MVGPKPDRPYGWYACYRALGGVPDGDDAIPGDVLSNLARCGYKVGCRRSVVLTGCFTQSTGRGDRFGGPFSFSEVDGVGRGSDPASSAGAWYFPTQVNRDRVLGFRLRAAPLAVDMRVPL